MPTPRTPKWISLSKARERLCKALGPHVELDELLANAILSKRVPIRGVPSWLKSRPVTIDGGLIRKADHVCVIENTLYLKKSQAADFCEPADFILVEIEWRKLEAFVHARRVKAPKPSDHKVNAAFVRSAARHQHAQTRPSRSEHMRELQQELPGMTKDQYHRARKHAIMKGVLPPEWGKSGRRRSRKKRRMCQNGSQQENRVHPSAVAKTKGKLTAGIDAI